VAQRGVDIDPCVGQQPVHLLGGMLGYQAARQSETLTDRIDGQGRGPDDAEGGVGQGQDALGVQVAIKQAGQEAMHVLEAEGLVRSHLAPESSCLRGRLATCRLGAIGS
jgi:hypothetical protein